jgi:ceramide glucosyltransferase
MWKLLLASLIVVWYVVLLALGFIALYGAYVLSKNTCTACSDFSPRPRRKRYHIRTKAPPPRFPPSTVELEGVSILRPLKGFDPNMYENLEMTFKQTYPKFEIIFAIADHDDPCIPLLHDLIAKYPHVDARIDIGEEVVGCNPKINNLMPAYRSSKYDILWIVDSNVFVLAETLSRSIDSLNSSKSSSSRIALVHHAPYAIFSDQEPPINVIGTHLERAYFNTNHARMYISLNLLKIDSCVMGKSNLYRKSDLEKLDGSVLPLSKQLRLYRGTEPVRGLAAFGKFAAEDAQIGLSIWHELGLPHALGADVAANALGPMSFSSYYKRRVRWIRVRKESVIAATILEPWTESVLAGVIMSWAANYLTRGSVAMWAAFVVHWSLWLIVDLGLRWYLTGTPFKSAGEGCLFVLAWVGRELLTLPIWMSAIWGSEIEWRGVKYTLSRGGIMSKVEPEEVARRRGSAFSRRRGSNEPLLANVG